MEQSYCYSFRFCCDPGFNDRREIASLQRFVREAQIDDVAVFCNVEELNTGHMTEEEQETIWLRLLSDVQTALAPEGVQLSVNHWHSLMHADLGKTLPQCQPFRRMVDMDGREANLCVCPMCENWQTYFAGLYARYAALSPHILWVEDDFRLHNHDPLHWGGCFCRAHMREYARRAGKPELTREEFVRGILQPGEVHLYRKIWLDVNRETMTALAERIGRAVRQVSPTVKVGLMSSVPYIHAAEGRSWYGILRGLAAGQPPVSRIHLPAYQETAPGQYLLRFNMVSMHNRALLPPETEIYPELENYPYSLFAKSRAFTRFQLLSSLPLNLKGMTIDLFDLNGSGIVFSDGYQQMLREVKPFLSAVNAMGVLALPKRGVCVMTSEDSAYTLHTAHGADMQELYPHEVYFAGLLNAMGIAYQYCTDPAVTGQVVAVSGQYFRNLTPEQITKLFERNTLLLSADAVDTLCQMGLGALAGVRSCQWMKQNSGAYTYEQVVNGKTYLGLSQARASAVILHRIFRLFPPSCRTGSCRLARTYSDPSIRTLLKPRRYAPNAAERAAARASAGYACPPPRRTDGRRTGVSAAVLHLRRPESVPVSGQRQPGRGFVRDAGNGRNPLFRRVGPYQPERTPYGFLQRGAERAIHF